MSCCVDYDPPEFINTTCPIARKVHKCCECHGVIQPGEVYERVAGKWEHAFDSFCTCEKCADLRDSLMEVACPAYYDLKETYIEYLHEIGAVTYNENGAVYPDNHLDLNRRSTR